VCHRYGTYSTSEALNAGLDLEMPGPTRWRTQGLVSHVLSAGKTSFETITERASAVLTLVQRLAKRSPEVVFGDGEALHANSAASSPRRELCSSRTRTICSHSSLSKGRR
jgi:hypothetical protein